MSMCLYFPHIVSKYHDRQWNNRTSKEDEADKNVHLKISEIIYEHWLYTVGLSADVMIRGTLHFCVAVHHKLT